MTNFYDFNIYPNIEVIERLEEFGFEGACIFYDTDKYDEDAMDNFNQLNQSTTLKLYHGIRINETNPQILRRNIQKYYGKVDLLMAEGHNPKVNRAICESRQVDIFNHPHHSNMNNCGINHVLAKLLKDNNITVNIDLGEILHHNRFFKAKLLNQLSQLLLLQDKYEFKSIISSGSKTFYDVRSPEDIILLGQLFSMDEQTAQENISTNVSSIINDITIHKQSIVEGVRIIKKEHNIWNLKYFRQHSEKRKDILQ